MTQPKAPKQQGVEGHKSGRSKPVPESLCSVPDCGRPSYTRGLCQTHYRQRLTDGQLRPIRPYRNRTPGTVKFAGLRLSARCARTLQKYADDRGLALGAAIADVLEKHVQKKRKKGSQS